MDDAKAEPLSDHALARCMQCGAMIWDYPTPGGKHVALDNVLGGSWAVDGLKAFKIEGTGGYRAHWDRCERIAAASLIGRVGENEFLWP